MITVSLYFTSPGALRTILLLLCVFLISWLFKFKWYNYCLLSILLFAINSVIEFIVVSVVSLAFGIDVTVVNDSKVFYFSGLLLSKILQFIVVIVIRVQKHKVLNKSKNHLVTLMLFPSSTIFIILLQYNFFEQYLFSYSYLLQMFLP